MIPVRSVKPANVMHDLRRFCDDAVRTLLSEMGQRVVAAYLGDDQTNEDAFEALKGRGLGMLVREQWRPTKADCWTTPPDQLLAFLTQWLQICQGGVGGKPK